MRLISEEKLYNIVGSLYETVNDRSPEAWLDIYQKMAGLLSSGAGSLTLFSQSENRFFLTATTWDQELVEQYNSFYQHVSPFRKQVVQMKAGERFSRAEQMSDRKFLKTEIYQDHFRRQEVFNYEYEVLFKEADLSAGISFSRSETMKNFGAAELRAMNFLIPHLRRAFRLYLQTAGIERERRILIDCLDRVPQGVIALDKHGKVVFFNEPAKKLLGRKDGLHVGRSGRLAADLRGDTKNLEALRASVFNPNFENGNNLGGVAGVSRASGRRPLTIMAAPFFTHSAADFSSERYALLFISDPDEKPENAELVLRKMYRLTAAESKIAVILAQGGSLNAVCETLAITQNTARTHLKRIFSKTETGRQSELVKLVLSSPAILRDKKIKKDYL